MNIISLIFQISLINKKSKIFGIYNAMSLVIVEKIMLV